MTTDKRRKRKRVSTESQKTSSRTSIADCYHENFNQIAQRDCYFRTTPLTKRQIRKTCNSYAILYPSNVRWSLRTLIIIGHDVLEDFHPLRKKSGFRAYSNRNLPYYVTYGSKWAADPNTAAGDVSWSNAFQCW